jgi:hypothetical protein
MKIGNNFHARASGQFFKLIFLMLDCPFLHQVQKFQRTYKTVQSGEGKGESISVNEIDQIHRNFECMGVF